MNRFDDRLPIVGILRGFRMDQLGGIVEAVAQGGLTNLEITMNSPAAAEQIREAARISAGKIRIGAGTVTTSRLLDEALSAGASFIVTPSLRTEIVNECVRGGIPVFPGAFSPTEVWEAWELGATMVKLFPAETVGPSFLKALGGPFPHVKLMPTGGVDLQTLPQFIKAGASGAGVGGPLFSKARIDASDWPWLENQARAFADTWRTHQADRESQS